MSERTRDRYSAVVLLALGIGLLLYATYSVQQGIGGPVAVGPAFFPKFLSISLMVLSTGLFLKSFLVRDSQYTGEALPSETTPSEGAKPWVGVLVFVIMIIYVFIVEPLGFVPATLVSMAAVMWVLSVRKWYFFLGLVAFVLLIQYVFETFLYIQLP